MKWFTSNFTVGCLRCQVSYVCKNPNNEYPMFNHRIDEGFTELRSQVSLSLMTPMIVPGDDTLTPPEPEPGQLIPAPSEQLSRDRDWH